jgi:hypothetical protein
MFSIKKKRGQFPTDQDPEPKMVKEQRLTYMQKMTYMVENPDYYQNDLISAVGNYFGETRRYDILADLIIQQLDVWNDSDKKISWLGHNYWFELTLKKAGLDKSQSSWMMLENLHSRS